MRKPARLPSMPPIQMTGGPVSWRKRWAHIRNDLAQAITKLATRIAGH